MSAGPDTMNEPCPSANTSGLPQTGAARKPTPAAAAAARIRADASSDTVEQSTSTPGRRSPANRPPSPSVTCSRSAGPVTMVNTSSQPASAAMSGATRAPRAASGAVLASVRFQTVTGRPASISRPAITLPILPVPSQPMLGSVVMRSPRLPAGRRR